MLTMLHTVQLREGSVDFRTWEPAKSNVFFVKTFYENLINPRESLSFFHILWSIKAALKVFAFC